MKEMYLKSKKKGKGPYGSVLVGESSRSCKNWRVWEIFTKRCLIDPLGFESVGMVCSRAILGKRKRGHYSGCVPWNFGALTKCYARTVSGV